MRPSNHYFDPYNACLYQMQLQMLRTVQNYPQFNQIQTEEKKGEYKQVEHQNPNHNQSTSPDIVPQPLSNNQNPPCKIQENDILKIENFDELISHPEKLIRSNKIQIQKEGRNANSNLLRMFLRRVEQRLEYQPNIISKIILKHKMKIKAKSFKEWLDINEVDYRGYVRLPEVRPLFVSSKNTREQTKIMRILLKDFLQKESICCYLTSKKMKRSAISYNLRCVKSLLSTIHKSRN